MIGTDAIANTAHQMTIALRIVREGHYFNEWTRQGIIVCGLGRIEWYNDLTIAYNDVYLVVDFDRQYLLSECVARIARQIIKGVYHVG